MQKLTPTQLKHYTDPKTLPQNTHSTQKLNYEFGQKRACLAIRTALDIQANGYHIFASGENGLGKRTLITRLLTEYAKNRPTPDDWVYTHNFTNPRSPLALNLPAGMGQIFANDIHHLWITARKQLNKRFRSDHYQTKVEAIKNEISLKEEQAYHALHEESKQYSLSLTVRPSDNKPIFIDNLHSTQQEDLTQEDCHQSSVNIQSASFSIKTLEKKLNSNHSANLSNIYVNNYQNKNHMQKRLNILTITLEKIEDEANQTLQALHHSLARRTLQPLFSPLFEKYHAYHNIINHLSTIHDDMVENVEHIINEDNEDFLPSYFSAIPARYFVNVMVTHQENSGAPIIFEDLPTHLNLLGHVEQITHLGTVSTDVSLIRAGSLHQANGGYLLLEANSLLEYPYAWQGLKRALQSKQIKTSSLEQMLTLTGSISLEPQPIPLNVKVILLGEPNLYYDLLEFEPEFNAVFKIRADFQDRVERTNDNEQMMVAKIADMVQKYQLLPFDNTALACLLDYQSEQAEDQQELSLHSDRLAQLLLESNRHAQLTSANLVTKQHVEQTIKDLHYRSGYLRQLYWQELEKGQQLISTDGYAIGQINALTVVSYADSEFGMPSRLTATVHHSAGNADILDIERDVDLAGSIHAKGVLIMSSYLKTLFSQEHLLNFTASLAFEQNYGGIDGDSATIAETCALLSALAQVPIYQGIAVTGSMNQFGQVQAVGGINAKIAGFYDVCLEQGLTGKQAVIIPKANLNQLMLRHDIIQSVKDEKFAIYAIEHVNEAMTLLTGSVPDECNKKGKYRKNSVYGRIHRRLKEWENKEHDKAHE